MIFNYKINDASLVLKAALAGEQPLYLYWPSNQSTLLYSESIIDLLNDNRVSKPLKVSDFGLSFLLQSGVVPPPKTAYENIYILGIGDSAKVETQNSKVNVVFSHSFPFMNKDRLSIEEMQPDEDLILKQLAEATISKIDQSKSSFLFHSAGKDSNSIALALAEAGWQDRVTLVTHKSKGSSDESEISKNIAKKLGFNHKTLFEINDLKENHHREIESFFINSPFPSTDNVTLAYPIYCTQLPLIKNSNIIDGGGNDSYMGTPLSKRDRLTLPLSKVFSHASFLRKLIKSESVYTPLVRTSSEWFGIDGLSLCDSSRIFSNSIDVYSHWKCEDKIRKNWDLFDFKTSILTSVTASEIHIRKVRNFSDSIGSNLILPFANEEIASYFGRMPELYSFDRSTLKNKLILRKMLHRRIGLDSDALGKLGFKYDSRTILDENWKWMFKEIESCSLWDKKEIHAIVQRLRNRMNGSGWGSGAACRALYRVYLLSAWFNNNKYLK